MNQSHLSADGIGGSIGGNRDDAAESSDDDSTYDLPLSQLKHLDHNGTVSKENVQEQNISQHSSPTVLALKSTESNDSLSASVASLNNNDLPTGLGRNPTNSDGCTTTSAASLKISETALRESIDECVESICAAPWDANIQFEVEQRFLSGEPGLPFAGTVCNLFTFTSKAHKGTVAIFNPEKYPIIPGGWKNNEGTWMKLSTDIIKAAEESGSQVSSGGRYGNSKDRRVIRCSNYRHYKQQSDKQADGEFRKYTMNRDRLNGRGSTGKSQKKNTKTARPMKDLNDSTCKAKIVIGINDHYLYLVGGLGGGTHEGHPPLGEGDISTRKRSVPAAATELANRLANKGVATGPIQDVVNDTYNVRLTRRQIAQTTEMAKLAKDLIGTENLEKHKDEMSDTDRVFAYLKSEGCSIVGLYHQKGDTNFERKGAASGSAPAKDVLISQSMCPTGEVRSSIIQDADSHEKAMQYAQDQCAAVGATDDQDVLVALVWVTPEGKRYFQAFPEQVSMDGTHKTTEEEWELVTLSVQDMNGRQEVVVRCWAPNNREWFFRWLLQTAVPKLVGKKTCEKVRLLICDGDAQECHQIDAALKSVYVNAVRRRCGWHIVDRSWNRNFGKQIGHPGHVNRKKIDKLEREIKSWLYSMMTEIETVEEYKISKSMLMAFVKSDEVASILEVSYVREIEKFLRNTIFVHEEKYARCYFLHVRAFDAYSNTPHEGTNKGAKYSDKRVLPNMSQAQSTKRLSMQDAERTERKRRQVSDSFRKKTVHSQTRTVQHIQKEAESQLQTEAGLAENYISIQQGLNTWQVLHTERAKPKANRPVFERVRTVTIDESGIMHCSCGYTNQFGIPDRHMTHVATYYGAGFDSWSHHDIAVRHHNSYCHLVATKSPDEMTEEEKQTRLNLQQLQDMNPPVPAAPVMEKIPGNVNKFAIGENCTIESNWSNEQVEARIQQVSSKVASSINYSDSDIQKALRLERPCENALGLTQSQHNCEDDDVGVSFASWEENTQEPPHSRPAAAARAEVIPVLKEVEQSYVNSSPRSKTILMEGLQELLKSNNKRRREAMGSDVPKGRIVSGKLRRKNPEKGHTKQV